MSTNEATIVVRLREMLEKKAPLNIHTHSQTHTYSPMVYSASLSAVDELGKIMTLKFGNNEINIPLQSIQNIWLHKSNDWCIAIDGLIVGNPPVDWWYYCR